MKTVKIHYKFKKGNRLTRTKERTFVAQWEEYLR